MKKLVFLFALVMSVATIHAQTRTSIKVNDLPKAVSENITTQHQGWTAMDAYKVDTKGVMTYEVIAKQGNSETVLVYDKDGKYLKMEPKKSAAEPTAKAAPKKEESKSIVKK